MRTKYNYVVTAVKVYPVVEFLEWQGEAYSSEQAIYLFKRDYGYVGIRDVHATRGTAVMDPNQVELKIV